MRMYSLKTLSIISIWQTALATRNQAQAIEPLTNEQNVLIKHLSTINHSCQDNAMKSAGLDKMQWYIWLYIEYAKLSVRSQNDKMSYNEQKENFTKTISMISKKIEHVTKNICKLYSKECTDQTSADQDLEIIRNLFEMTKEELSVILKDIDKCLTNLQSEKSAPDKKVKDAEMRNLPLKNIRKLLESHEKSNTDFCKNGTQQTYRESAEQFVEAIGTCISDDLKKEFESLIKDPTTKDKDTLFNRFTLTMQKLHGVLAFFYAYDDFKIINSILNSQEESVKMTLSAFLENLELEIKKLSTKLRDKAKDNEKSKEKLAREFTKEQAATFNLDRLCFDEILWAQSDLRITNANEQKIKMNINAIANILKGNNSNNEIKRQQLYAHLLNAFKTHLSTYHRLLLEIDANNKEKDSAHAEFIKIAIYLKHVMFKARKALFAIDKIRGKKISKNDRALIEKFPNVIAQAIGTVYTLQKVRSDFLEEQAERLSEKIRLLQIYSERLKEKILGLVSGKAPKSRDMESFDSNPEIPSDNMHAVRDPRHSDFDGENFISNFTKDHKEIDDFLDSLQTKKDHIYKCKDAYKKFIGAKNKDVHSKQPDAQENLQIQNFKQMAEETQEIIKKLLELDQESINDTKDAINDSKTKNKKQKLVELLNEIVLVHSEAAKILEMYNHLKASEVLDENFFKELTQREQIGAYVLSKFRVLKIYAELVMSISNEIQLVDRIKKTSEYKSALAGDLEKLCKSAGKYFKRKIFGGHKSEYDRIKKQAIKIVCRFQDHHKDKTEVYFGTCDNTKKDNESDDVAIAVQYILDYYISVNSILDFGEKEKALFTFKRWIEKNKPVLNHCYYMILRKTKGDTTTSKLQLEYVN